MAQTKQAGNGRPPQIFSAERVWQQLRTSLRCGFMSTLSTFMHKLALRVSVLGVTFRVSIFFRLLVPLLLPGDHAPSS